MNHQVLEPPGWARPRGYANGIVAEGRQIFLAGQVGWNAEQQLVSDELAAQVRQALANIVELLSCAGARPEHLVRLIWFVTSREEYFAAIEGIGAPYREVIGRHFPAMSVVQVAGLLEPRAKVEIEATAVF